MGSRRPSASRRRWVRRLASLTTLVAVLFAISHNGVDAHAPAVVTWVGAAQTAAPDLVPVQPTADAASTRTRDAAAALDATVDAAADVPERTRPTTSTAGSSCSVVVLLNVGEPSDLVDPMDIRLAGTVSTVIRPDQERPDRLDRPCRRGRAPPVETVRSTHPR
ncbi:MAG TPA: hypothetical protein VI076_10695 [Actinopolymorphaceae bacterium]